MNSTTGGEFWKLFAKLPTDVQHQARAAFELFLRDPAHGSLQFKLLDRRRHLYSVRVGLSYRALALRTNDQVVWFWIGSHAEYDHLDFNA